jgi:ATP-binding protein involved in chromosome partitioning
MARKTSMRLLGVVENMAGEVFGSGGGEELAHALEVPLLGRVPLDIAVRETGDAGEPLVWAQPESPTAGEIVRIAEAVDAARERKPAIVKALPVLS